MQITTKTTEIRIGTCGYSYPGPPPKGWHGVFYPERKPRGFDELAFYADFFNAVEINSSFYRPPTVEMTRAWAAKTPPDFQFSVKAWQKFTHATKLGEENAAAERWEPPAAADVDIFKAAIAPLTESGKLCAVLFQYPAGFYFNPANADRLAWTLNAFRGFPIIVELRHRSWSDSRNKTEDLLADGGAVWAVIDEPKFPSSVRQPFAPNRGIFYLRLHGRNREQWWEHGESWQRYDYLYGQAKMQALARKIEEIAQAQNAKKIMAFFNNHARGRAVADALMLKRALGLEIPGPLPTALKAAYPELAPKAL